MILKLPKLSLVVLVGPSGSGKSTFARKHFRPTEVLSSDAFRGWVSDDENDQSVTKDAFELLHQVAAKRLEHGRLTVIDATNVQPEARRPLMQLAKKYHCLAVAIVLNIPEEVCHQRNQERPDRSFGSHVVRRQRSQLRRSIKSLKREGFRQHCVLETPDEVESVTIERVPLWNDRRDERGPFDIIGDVHGCCDELEQLLLELGYQEQSSECHPLWGDVTFRHPEGRRAFFVGDLVDRGPRSLDVVRIVRNMVTGGDAFCVPGNHDMKLVRKLRGKNVQIRHGLETTCAEIDRLPEAMKEPFCSAMADFLDGLVSHLVVDNGDLVVAHAGMKEEFQGRASGKVRSFALYGETTGEIDEFGLPVRCNWAAEYRGSSLVVYGHTPVPEPQWLNGTVNIDTGCVFGGKLSALRYPEKEIVSVPALRTYCEPKRPFLDVSVPESEERSAQHQHDDLLEATDVMGKRIITTKHSHSVTIREENAAAALEVISRWAANPKWLIYLPPTMSPCETSEQEGVLEHPSEAFAYYQRQGVQEVVCEEKHMGSRAVVVVCRDLEAAARRFGIQEGESGIVYTRTGRRFFDDSDLETQFLQRLQAAMTAAGFWEKFDTSWACFDCELMPWSAKAQQLIRSQYASVGAAGTAAYPPVISVLQQAAQRLEGSEVHAASELLERSVRRHGNVARFVDAYRQYCWPVETLGDFKLAPFHVMATEGKLYTDRNHQWHMDTLAEICHQDPGMMLATKYQRVSLDDPDAVGAAVQWWMDLTANGGEGMVVKPLDWIVRGKKGLVQPAVKCRGKEYLRIIYSPDYDSEQNLERLRKRGLGRKRSLALREFALGLEGLERFAREEPLRRVHECVFGVLALESEPVDPRL